MDKFFNKTISSVILLGILLGMVPQVSFAQVNPRSMIDSLPKCGWTDFLNLSCILKGLSYVQLFIFTIVGWFTGITGNLFNFSLGVSINNKFYTGAAITPIVSGWEFTRDLVNIFFIFAILLIAIATILGIESYGAKSLLARLIIIALLINFSLLATQAIIFVTNALAYELYSAVSNTGSSSFLLNSSQPGFNKDLTGALMQGLLQQNLFKPSSPFMSVGPQSSGFNPTSQEDTALSVYVRLVAGTFILIFAAFIFAAGAFFMAVRMAMLWLLMTIAPFGFVFLILPATKSYAQKWWSTLQSQALFAPAFLFFLLITIKMAQGPIIGVSKQALTAKTNTTELLFLLIMQNLVIFIMLGGSLIIAKTLGIYGADGAIKMAQKGGQWFRGATGRVARGTVRQATAPLAEWTAKNRFLGRVPLLGRGAASIAAAQRQSVAEYQKKIEKYNSSELKNLLGGARIRPVQSQAIIQELAKRGDLSFGGALTEGRLRAIHSQMKREGANTRDIERLWPELSLPQNVSQGLSTATPAARWAELTAAGPTNMKTLRDTARRIRPDDLNKMDDSVADQSHTMDAIAASLSVGSAQATFNRGGRLHQGITDAIKRLNQAAGRSTIGPGPLTLAQRAEVAQTLRDLGNNSLANWIENAPIGQAFM